MVVRPRRAKTKPTAFKQAVGFFVPMESLSYHLKRACLSYVGVAVPLALMPGTGVKLLSVALGLAVIGLGYGYFNLMRQLF